MVLSLMEQTYPTLLPDLKLSMYGCTTSPTAPIPKRQFRQVVYQVLLIGCILLLA